jgi:hypothetical protein
MEERLPLGTEKKCTKCGEIKSISDFPWKSKKYNHHMAMCLDCQHKYYREIYYPKNKERIIKATMKYHKSHRDRARKAVTKNTEKNIKKNTEYLKNILIPKELLKCSICGFNESLIPLEGHHLDGSQKIYKEDTLSRWLRRSHETFLNKISNVYWVLLCKNCHARLHANEITLPQNIHSLNNYFKKGE